MRASSSGPPKPALPAPSGQVGNAGRVYGERLARGRVGAGPRTGLSDAPLRGGGRSARAVPHVVPLPTRGPAVGAATPVRLQISVPPAPTPGRGPAPSSWLNLAERWFAEPTNRKPRRSAHHDVIELEADIRTWINEWNKNSRPFVRIKIADQILETLTAYCQRTNDSRHWTPEITASPADASARQPRWPAGPRRPPSRSPICRTAAADEGEASAEDRP